SSSAGPRPPPPAPAPVSYRWVGLGRAALLIVSSVALGVPAVARAQDAGQVVSAPAEATELPEVVVRGRAEDLLGAGVSASQGVLDRVDLEDKPLLRRGEV